MTFLFDVI